MPGMTASTIWPFQSPLTHEAVSAIIRRRSVNQQDIREVALRGLDLSSVRRILDLGCGFGFMTEQLARRVADDAEFVGVDVWPDNEQAFRQRVVQAGRRADFRCMEVNSTLPWPEGAFDLVCCCFSLYFFPEVIPEIARVLTGDGLLLIVTHSERSVEGQLAVAGYGTAASKLVALARMFSAENGREKLAGSFSRIKRIDYHNELRFEAGHREELDAYLRFKLPLLVPNAALGDDLPEGLRRFIEDRLADPGEVVIDKNDAIFHCRNGQ